jgi:hypothetical protein
MNNLNLPTVDVKYLASIEFGSGGGRRPEFVRFIIRVEKRLNEEVLFYNYLPFMSLSIT